MVNKKTAAVICGLVILAAAAAGLYYGAVTRFIPQRRYETAQELADAGEYEEAIRAFEALGEYGDSADKAIETRFLMIRRMIDRGEYEEAIGLLDDLSEYPQSNGLRSLARYGIAEDLLKDGSLEEAAAIYEELGDFGDAEDKLHGIWYRMAENELLVFHYDRARELLEKCGDYKDCEELVTNLGNVFDLVYETPFANAGGDTTEEASSYLWVHSLITPGDPSVILIMQEDFAIGEEIPSFFGAGILNYRQETAVSDTVYRFSYPLSTAELTFDMSKVSVLLETVFDGDFAGMESRRIYRESGKDMEQPMKRRWELLEDEEKAESIREGFRHRLLLEQVMLRNPYFEGALDDDPIEP